MLKDSKKFVTNTGNTKILTEIVDQLNSCDEFIISVAFVTFSGVICILENLQQLKIRRIKGKILTGCYLNFTEPKALEKLLEFENIELKILDNENFHAKGFFFRRKGCWSIMLGSSNLTQSALTVNNEWNLLFKAAVDDIFLKQILAEFKNLFNQASYVRDMLDGYREIYQSQSNLLSSKTLVLNRVKIIPNKIQVEALKSLEKLRLNGEDKALIISATGTGKTFLSAFDVLAFKPERCLFIVHRTNIAIRAKESFSKIISSKSLGLYTGGNKSSADYLFATVQTLKNPKTLAIFRAEEFDYIIIDEVHHAEAESYRKVLAHFKPKFLLGMTATPERTDSADIFKLFNYNIAYEIRLHQALDQNLLSPFHYFAIEDLYIESEKKLAKDFTRLTSYDRVNHIVEKMNFYGHSGQYRSALMFVSNVDEAKELASKLNIKGIKAKSLTSQDPEYIRENAICELESNRLEVIVTVDIFNEGIDIPCLNQIILLRPTQSAIVYVQQLGRGLRKYKDKEFVVVLDFIANYENNFLIPIALSQDNSYDKDQLKKFMISPNNYIVGESTVTFSHVAKELIYKNIQKTNFSQLKNIKRDYKQLKNELGRIPALVDFQNYNFISPEVILSTKDTYYDILRAFKEEIIELNTREYNVLKFISKEFTPAKRLYEILILEYLLSVEITGILELEKKLSSLLIDFDKNSFENALQHLTLHIFTVNAGRQNYEPIISINNGVVSLSIIELVKDNCFLYGHIKDLIEYNKLIYIKKYSCDKYVKLALYSKYMKKDIAHLLNQDYTNGGVNLAGYRVFDGKALLFITFDENKKNDSYDNRFISSNSFTFFSKKGKSLNDSIEKALSMNKYVSYVFARVNKGESYFFLGLVSKCLDAKEIVESQQIIRYIFELEHVLSKDMWDYFKAIYKSKN